jgi:hypothetical protein
LKTSFSGNQIQHSIGMTTSVLAKDHAEILGVAGGDVKKKGTKEKGTGPGRQKKEGRRDKQTAVIATT